ncbi:MAG: hypothetical protein AAGC44_07275 [Planctomycetota bacterium]
MPDADVNGPVDGAENLLRGIIPKGVHEGRVSSALYKKAFSCNAESIKGVQDSHDQFKAQKAGSGIARVKAEDLMALKCIPYYKPENGNDSHVEVGPERISKSVAKKIAGLMTTGMIEWPDTAAS